MIQATQLHNTSTKSNHGPPELCMEIYTLSGKWISCEKTEGAAMGSPLSAVIGNLNMERFKEQAVTSSPNIHRCGLLAGKYNSLCPWARLQVQH